MIKGTSRGGAASLAAHLLRADTNETVEVLEIGGVLATDLPEALREMEAVAAGARTRKVFYHASINAGPGETLDRAQTARAIKMLGKALGLHNQPHVVVRHCKGGRQHLHVVWSRIDLGRMAAIPDGHNFRKHEEVARALEREFRHRRVDGAHAERHDKPRPRRTRSHAEQQQQERTGITIDAVTAEITALWQATPTGQAFAAALAARQYVLARGQRRSFVVVDVAGGVHSLTRRIEGATAAQVRARMADLDRDALPTVAEARAMQLARFGRRAGIPHNRTRRPDAGPSPRRTAPPRGSAGRHRKAAVAAMSTRVIVGAPPDLTTPAVRAAPPAMAILPTAAASSARHQFRPAAQAVCGSLRLVLPLACKGRGESDDRPPRLRHGRQVARRHARQRRARAEAGGEVYLDGIAAAIAADVHARAALASAGIRAEFARRMDEVCRSSPRQLVEGLLQALRREMDQLLASIAENATGEARARQRGTIMARGSRSRPPDEPADADADADEDTSRRPAAAFAGAQRRLAR